MRARIVLALLMLLAAAGFATAPAWVSKGVNLTYSVGSDSVTFAVLDRSAGDLKIQIFTKSTNHLSTATENESADSGQFWFDDSLLENAVKFQHIGDYEVTDVGTGHYAGKDYNTITLTIDVGGATSTKVYDKETGLLLRNTVDAEGAPVVNLQSAYIPAFAPPPPPVNNTPPPANSTTSPPANPPPANTSQPPSNASQPAQQPPAQTPPPQHYNTSPPATDETQPQEPQPDKKKLPCCPSVILPALLAVAVLRR
jgi:hypothetical protein